MSQAGAFLIGKNLILKALSGGKIELGADELMNYFALKGHNDYTGTHLRYASGAISTTDATVTKIVGIPIAVDKACGIWALTLAWQNDWNDVTASFSIGAARRLTSGNVTLEGTASHTIVEGDTATNVTLVANTTSQEAEISFTGIAAESWFAVSHVFYAYGGTAS
jgi:hypothetical protein